jgi:hypothetical protein
MSCYVIPKFIFMELISLLNKKGGEKNPALSVSVAITTSDLAGQDNRNNEAIEC